MWIFLYQKNTSCYELRFIFLQINYLLVATCGEVTLGHEQYLRLTVELPSTETLDDENSSGFTHIIVVADRSGSMAGSPWNQVYSNT